MIVSNMKILQNSSTDFSEAIWNLEKFQTFLPLIHKKKCSFCSLIFRRGYVANFSSQIPQFLCKVFF